MIVTWHLCVNQHTDHRQVAKLSWHRFTTERLASRKIVQLYWSSYDTCVPVREPPLSNHWTDLPSSSFDGHRTIIHVQKDVKNDRIYANFRNNIFKLLLCSHRLYNTIGWEFKTEKLLPNCTRWSCLTIDGLLFRWTSCSSALMSVVTINYLPCELKELSHTMPVQPIAEQM